MENNDEYDDDDTPIYKACLGCPHDDGFGICDVLGPCQAYPNAEDIGPAPVEELAPEVAAPVEMLMLPPAVITTPDNGRLFMEVK